MVGFITALRIAMHRNDKQLNHSDDKDNAGVEYEYIPPLLAQNTRTVSSWTNTATSSIPSSFAFAIILGV